MDLHPLGHISLPADLEDLVGSERVLQCSAWGNVLSLPDQVRRTAGCSADFTAYFIPCPKGCTTMDHFSDRSKIDVLLVCRTTVGGEKEVLRLATLGELVHILQSLQKDFLHLDDVCIAWGDMSDADKKMVGDALVEKGINLPVVQLDAEINHEDSENHSISIGCGLGVPVRVHYHFGGCCFLLLFGLIMWSVILLGIIVLSRLAPEWFNGVFLLWAIAGVVMGYFAGSLFMKYVLPLVPALCSNCRRNRMYFSDKGFYWCDYCGRYDNLPSP
jgi:hypothetical protein